uniref:Uncharacterized protein n=1 Tax=Trichogramma kaykai TaxID=54128 RepID=A0ABD2XNU6_9HYME
MEFLTNLLLKSSDVGESWYDDEEFAIEAKKNHGQAESVALRPDPATSRGGRETTHARGLLGAVALGKIVGPSRRIY